MHEVKSHCLWLSKSYVTSYVYLSNLPTGFLCWSTVTSNQVWLTMLATNKRDIHTCTCTHALKYTQHNTRWMSVLWRNTSWTNSLTPVKRKDAECFQTERSRKVSLTLTPLEIHQKKERCAICCSPPGRKTDIFKHF